jgi:iron complex outermembrane receptor protein
VDNTFFGATNATEGYLQYAGRAQLLWQPTEGFKALLSVHAMHLDGTPRVFRANIIQPGTNDFVPGFNREIINQDAQRRATQEVDIEGAHLRIDWDLGFGTLTSITGWEHASTLSRGDIDGGAPNGPGFIPFQAESADGLPHHQQWSQELRLAGTAGSLRYVVGGFWFNEDVDIDSFDYFSNDFLEAKAVQHQETTTWAVFGNLTYDFTEQLTGAVGIRYTSEEKDFQAQRLFSILFGPTPVRTVNTQADNVSWNASLTYAVNDDINIYGRVATGFRAPSIQGRLLFGDFPSVADTETIVSYEAGIKAYGFDRRLRANAAVFYYQLDDMQLTAVGGAANFNQLVNADNATGYGFELDIEARPNERWLFTGGLSYNHTEIDSPGLAVSPCTGGCTPIDPPGVVPGTVVIDGNSLPNAPRWIANITARYGLPFREGEFFVFTDWAYRSHINFFLYESREFSDDMLLEGGLRVGYSYHDGDWEVAAFVRNITNDLSLEGGIDFNNLTGFVNDPRMAGVEVKVRLR